MTRENTNETQQPKSEQIISDDEKKCLYCSTLMPATASVCYQCKQNQVWWKNHLRIDYFGQVIALIMMLIAYQQLQEARNERIAAKDAMEKARKAEEVATSIGKNINNVQGEVNDQRSSILSMVDAARKSSLQLHKIQADTVSSKNFIFEIKGKISKEYDALALEVQTLKERNMLTKLGDKAIAEGSSNALEELKSYIKNPKKVELKSFAIAEILRVKIFYISGTRMKGMSITTTLADGTKKLNADIPTSYLIDALKNNADWIARAKAAELLGSRIERGVPESLIAAFQDARLDVAKTALDSFASITGFTSNDVLGFSYAEEWWEKNKSEASKKLKS